MDKEEQKRIVRQQRAGFARLRQREIERYLCWPNRALLAIRTRLSYTIPKTRPV